MLQFGPPNRPPDVPWFSVVVVVRLVEVVLGGSAVSQTRRLAAVAARPPRVGAVGEGQLDGHVGQAGAGEQVYSLPKWRFSTVNHNCVTLAALGRWGVFWARSARLYLSLARVVPGLR